MATKKKPTGGARVAKAAALAALAGKTRKVTVRVPAKLQKESALKPEVKGTVERVYVVGRVAKVLVNLGAKGSFEFRPQDVTI